MGGGARSPHTQHNMLPQPTSNNHLLSFESIYKVQTFKQQLSVLIDVVNVVRPSAAGGRTHDVGGEERSQSTDATWDLLPDGSVQWLCTVGRPGNVYLKSSPHNIISSKCFIDHCSVF